MTIHWPVHVGDVVASIYAEMRQEGTTMTIDIEAWVTRQPSGRRLKVIQAKLVFAAVNDEGRKRPLPAVSP